MKYQVGKRQPCPTCGSERATIIWKSGDEKTIAIQCPASGRFHKKNAVMLLDS